MGLAGLGGIAGGQTHHRTQPEGAGFTVTLCCSAISASSYDLQRNRNTGGFRKRKRKETELRKRYPFLFNRRFKESKLLFEIFERKMGMLGSSGQHS